MFPIVLRENEFDILLLSFAVAPLILLVCLFFARNRAQRCLLASFIFLVPALLVVGLWAVTNGQTEPKLGDVGSGLLIYSAMWVALACSLSLFFGAFCVRIYRWTLVWLIPEAMVALALGYFLLRAFT